VSKRAASRKDVIGSGGGEADHVSQIIHIK
jgi:hypothetical protein